MRKPSLTSKGDFETYSNKATSNIVNLEFEVHNIVSRNVIVCLMMLLLFILMKAAVY